MTVLQSWMDNVVTSLKKSGPVVFLESQLTQHPDGNASFIAGMPRIQLVGEENTIFIYKRGNSKPITRKGNIWNLAANYLHTHADWYFGYLNYDLKNSIEQLYSNNVDPIKAPEFWLFSPGFLAKVDHTTQQKKVLRDDFNLNVVGTRNHSTTTSTSTTTANMRIGKLSYSVSPEAYQRTIEKAKELIYEGDIYEINLAHQSKATFTGDSFQLYKEMRKVGPVPFGAYLSLNNIDVCCASPERFLAKKGNKVWSHPIKGTTKRSADPATDKKLKEALTTSEKEQAENLMIVDLVRHDLNKIAIPGSVKVEKLFDVETFETVHQMVSRITARSNKNNVLDIIKSCFPMGSMTGAPKIRAMQCIEELELFRRGMYSGAIGYVTPENDFDFNVVIRTAIIKDRSLYYAAGGAITCDSDPKNEWNETLLKKQALINV